MSINRLSPKTVESGQPTFAEPWQAQALAMADLLIQTGKITPSEWSETLGDQLSIKQAIDDTQDNYYLAVLDALNDLIQDKNILSTAQLEQRQDAWKQAYLSTPHGQPVKLNSTDQKNH